MQEKMERLVRNMAITTAEKKSGSTKKKSVKKKIIKKKEKNMIKNTEKIIR